MWKILLEILAKCLNIILVSDFYHISDHRPHYQKFIFIVLILKYDRHRHLLSKDLKEIIVENAFFFNMFYYFIFVDVLDLS